MKKTLTIQKINTRSDIDNVTPARIENYPWGNSYTPAVDIYLAYGDDAFFVKLVAHESSIRAVNRNHNSMVCLDSCMEFFFSPDPEKTDAYFNYEINPLGTLHLAYGPDRYTRRMVDENLFAEFNIETELLETKWTACYTIPFSFIARFSDKKSFSKGDVIKGNMYKCGDHTKNPHWGCYFNIDLEKADYHRPDFFGEIILG